MTHELLRTNISLEEAVKIQKKYSRILKESDQRITKITGIEQIKWIAGTDISYFKYRNEEWGVSCAVLWNLTNFKL